MSAEISDDQTIAEFATSLLAEIDETTALLVRARGYVERGWCRGTLAKNANGHLTSPMAADAVAWCALGALIAATGITEDWHLSFSKHPACARLRDAMGGEHIARFNNRQETVEPVLKAFDRAIAAGGG